MEASQPNLEKDKSPSKLYLAIGMILLFCVALFWSLDRSFIYIFLGAAVFFFYLFFRNLKITIPKQEQRSSHRSQSTFSFRSGNKSKTESRTQSSDVGKKIVMRIFGSVFAIFFLLFIIGLFSDDSESDEELSNFMKAEQFRWNSEYDSASYYYQKVLAEDPDHEEALVGYGGTLIAQQQYDSALHTYDRLIELHPDHPEAYYHKALVYQYLKDFQKSLGQIFYLLKDHPDYYQACIVAGDDYYLQQRYDSALAWYNNAYDHDQKNAWVCHVMGYLNQQKGNTDNAVNLYREALSFDSTNVEIYDRLSGLFPGQEGEQYRTMIVKLKSQGY